MRPPRSTLNDFNPRSPKLQVTNCISATATAPDTSAGDQDHDDDDGDEDDDHKYKLSRLASIINSPCSGDCAPGQCLGMQIGLEPQGKGTGQTGKLKPCQGQHRLSGFWLDENR